MCIEYNKRILQIIHLYPQTFYALFYKIVKKFYEIFSEFYSVSAKILWNSLYKFYRFLAKGSLHKKCAQLSTWCVGLRCAGGTTDTVIIRSTNLTSWAVGHAQCECYGERKTRVDDFVIIQYTTHTASDGIM